MLWKANSCKKMRRGGGGGGGGGRWGWGCLPRLQSALNMGFLLLNPFGISPVSRDFVRRDVRTVTNRCKLF